MHFFAENLWNASVSGGHHLRHEESRRLIAADRGGRRGGADGFDVRSDAQNTTPSVPPICPSAFRAKFRCSRCRMSLVFLNILCQEIGGRMYGFSMFFVANGPGFDRLLVQSDADDCFEKASSRLAPSCCTLGCLPQKEGSLQMNGAPCVGKFEKSTKGKDEDVLYQIAAAWGGRDRKMVIRW